jgi:3-hydroxybutyryl-CoA dehydratase
MLGKTIDELKIGDHASAARTISEADVYGFGGIIGDLNPLHTNQVVASQSVFKNRVAHGMLTASLLSGVIAHQLPGNGTIFLGLEVKFLKPVFFGDTVDAQVEVKEIVAPKHTVILTCRCVNQHCETVLEGEARVMAPRKPKA